MEDVLSCPVCLEPFDLQVRLPLVLACGHTLCRSCVTAMLSSTPELHCPHDRSTDSRPLNALSRNYLVCDAIERTNKLQSQRCSKHRKTLRLYCRQPCGQLLCSRCLLDGHRAHQVVDPEEESFATTVAEALKPHMELSRRETERLADHLKRLEGLVATCERRKEYAKEMTMSEHERIVELLRSKAEEQIQHLEGQAAAYKAPIMEAGHYLKQRYDKLLDYHHQLLSVGTALLRSPIPSRLSLLVQLDSLISSEPDDDCPAVKFAEPPMFLCEDLGALRERVEALGGSEGGIKRRRV